MTQYEIERLWVEKRLDVMFRFADIVRMKAGEHAGREGKIVALIRLEPQPTYVIEWPDEASAVAVESDLESCDWNTGETLVLRKL